MNQSGWQLGESTAAGYERHLVPAIFAPWAERLIGLTPPRPGERVLDVACGTGIVARTAARRMEDRGQIVGVDINEGMLEVARAVSGDIRPHIEWQQGGAGELPFPDESFDLLYCQQGLQFFPNWDAALKDMGRVLAPGGRLTLAVWRTIDHNPGFAALVAALEKHVGPETALIMRSPFPVLSQDELRQMVSHAGLTDVRMRIAVGAARFDSAGDLIDNEEQGSPLAGPLGDLDTATREALRADLDERLEPWTDDDGVVLPLQSHFITARR
ncbi:methyltransferase domain-containing protein [Actinomadura sp. 6N118]|uniref:methyltransferase domain-containing protein n=1 Tax=Actinomadura sp. 6N118 TaxID=3375151 RepID=UPI00379E3B92